MKASVTLLETRRFVDDRGWFAETYATLRMSRHGIHDQFVQDNTSCSTRAGTLRGLHFQAPPKAQAKLVYCTKGAIFDVVVDLRRGSPTFARSATVKLSASNGRQLYVPIGFGHGFLTLEDHTEVAYKVSNLYEPDLEQGVAWNDPDLAISWPLERRTPILSDRDAGLPKVSEIESPFVYDGIPMNALGGLD
jgi:dTDP-4-dehydrorhamnose 3,5-epimerase